MRVLVTGASGFIGSVACAQLRERGHEALALVRRPGSEPAGSVAVTGDLTDARTMRAALSRSEVDTVLHCAAETGAQSDPAKLRAANVGGMLNLIDACQSVPRPPRVVFTSTVVTGDSGGRLMTESDRPTVETDYGRTKQEGEQMLAASGLDVAIVRPCHVYGPGGWWANEIIPLLRRPGRFAIVGSGENLWDVVHVDDVANACVLAVESAAPGSLYHCADDTPTTYREFMERTAAAIGAGRPRSLPVWLARRAAGSGPVAALVRSGRTANDKLKTQLGWQPRYPDSREGIPAAAAALAARG